MKSISYIGCDDPTLDLFEGQYALPDGMCYNSYLLCADKVAVLDSIDPRCTDEWLNKLEKSLMGRKPDYLVVHHMEPDHSGSLARFLQIYPDAEILCSKVAQNMMTQFGISHAHVRIIKEGVPKRRSCSRPMRLASSASTVPTPMIGHVRRAATTSIL